MIVTILIVSAIIVILIIINVITLIRTRQLEEDELKKFFDEIDMHIDSIVDNIQITTLSATNIIATELHWEQDKE